MKTRKRKKVKDEKEKKREGEGREREKGEKGKEMKRGGKEGREGERKKERERSFVSREHIISNTSNTLRTISSYHFTKRKLWHSIVNFLRMTLSFRIIYVVFIII